MLQSRRTNGHEEQLARPDVTEEAVDVVEHAQEHLSLRGGRRLQTHSTHNMITTGPTLLQT